MGTARDTSNEDLICNDANENTEAPDDACIFNSVSFFGPCEKSDERTGDDQVCFLFACGCWPHRTARLL
jgi:hypothetical protein